MNKKQQASELTRKRIVESARQVFVQKGYAATSIEDLVAATGSSKGNIYYHFKSKEGLLLHLLEEWEQEWLEQWNEKEQQYETITEKLYGIAKHLVENGYNHPLTKVADEFYGSDWQESAVKEQVAQIMVDRLRFNEELLRKGMEQGEFEKDEAAVLGVIFEALLMGLGEIAKESTLEEVLSLYKKSMDVFLYGIAKKK